MKWNTQWLEEKIKEFYSVEQFPTYSAFLIFAGITNDVLSDLRMEVLRSEVDAVNYFRLLDGVKTGVEAHMEKCLIYQEKYFGKQKLDLRSIGNMWNASKTRGVFDINREMKIVAGGSNAVQLPKLQNNESGFSIEDAITKATKRV